jgi:hypothetical protein
MFLPSGILKKNDVSYFKLLYLRMTVKTMASMTVSKL